MCCITFSTSREASTWPRPCSDSTPPMGKADLGVSKIRHHFPGPALCQVLSWLSGTPSDFDEPMSPAISEAGRADRVREMGPML